MAVLDNNTPDPAKTPFLPIALRYGAIWGGISVLITLIGYVSGWDPAMPDTGMAVKAVFYLVSIGLTIWAISSAIKEDRDKQLGGYIGLGRCVGLGTVTALVSSAISGVFAVVYMSLINPDYQEGIKSKIMEQYEAQGMSEEQIEMAMGFASGFTNPFSILIMSLVFGAIFGLIFSLIIGLIMKRDPFQ